MGLKAAQPVLVLVCFTLISVRFSKTPFILHSTNWEAFARSHLWASRHCHSCTLGEFNRRKRNLPQRCWVSRSGKWSFCQLQALIFNLWRDVSIAIETPICCCGAKIARWTPATFLAERQPAAGPGRAGMVLNPSWGSLIGVRVSYHGLLWWYKNVVSCTFNASELQVPYGDESPLSLSPRSPRTEPETDCHERWLSPERGAAGGFQRAVTWPVTSFDTNQGASGKTHVQHVWNLWSPVIGYGWICRPGDPIKTGPAILLSNLLILLANQCMQEMPPCYTTMLCWLWLQCQAVHL